MKVFFFLCISILLTIANIALTQTIIPGGDVSGTWLQTGSPYLVQGEITIPNGQTLWIRPGCLVEFQGHYKLNVQGRLMALGTESDSIIFTINDTTGFSNPDTTAGGWHGISFIYTSSANDSSKIVYCRLQYGKDIGSSWPDNNGGAIRVYNFSKLLISHCLFDRNIANSGDYPTGGAIQISDYSNIMVTNCTISRNIADNGGGIMISGNATPSIINCNIINNYAMDSGGGICCWDEGNPLIKNSTVSGNTANVGGGINAYRSDLQVDSCTFIENEAVDGNGGAIHYYSDTTTTSGITNSSFLNNTASFLGGAVLIGKENTDSLIKNVIIDKCEFRNNQSFGAGGLFIAGNAGNAANFSLSNSIFIENETIGFSAGFGFTYSIGDVYNCVFISNQAATGGGNWNSGGGSVWGEANVDFINCTFADNSASYGAGLGVGMGGIATTTNCIFWGNSTDQIALDTLNGVGGTLTVNYCDVQGGEDSVNVIDTLSTLVWGSENIDADPFFVNSGNGDYHLQDNSPCIGAGIDSIEIGSIWHCCPVCDCEGNIRPNPPGSMPDVGAYENPLATPLNISQELLQLPTKFSLFQNYPNPFNPTTKIKYDLPKPEKVKIEIFNLLGQKIETLLNKPMPAGSHEVEFTAKSLPSGVYLYRIDAGEFQAVKKMILLR